MTLDETTLSSALHELAAAVPDDPTRLACVHHRALRLHRRRRALGAGALAATMVATVAGAEVFVSSEGRRVTSEGRPARSGPAGSPTAPAPPASPLPACPDRPKASAPAAPPAVGEQFTGGGIITAPGTATAVTVAVPGDVIAGPPGGSDLVLAITPGSKIFLSSATPDVPEVAATGDQLRKGEAVKFSATRTSASSYVLNEMHAGPVPSGGPVNGDKAASSPSLPTPPAIGDRFKVAGVVRSSTTDSVTVNVTGGNLTGIVTFTLHCAPAQPLTGDEIDVAGIRTGPTTFDAIAVGVTKAPRTP
jgi:hypothetical protein